MPTLRQRNKHVYWAWKSMKQRCQNPNCSAYHNYGARGISVCDDWQSFETFCEWALSSGYEPGLDLDRIDNDRDYTPSNCRWIKRKDNINNRRNTTFLTVDGITKPRTEWEESAGITPGIVKAWVIMHGLEYAESRIKEVLERGYTKHNYGYSHGKAIIHTESGNRFNTVRQAALFYGLAPCTISNAMRENRATSKGRFNWEEISD